MSMKELEIEGFYESYIRQIRNLCPLSDLEIRMFLRQKQIEDPEWMEVLRARYKKNMEKIDRQIIDNILNNPHKVIDKIESKESVANKSLGIGRKVA